MPAIVAGFLLAFTFSFDDYVITSFVSGPGSSTLPLFVFGQVKRGVSPETNAVAAMMLLLTLTILIVGQVIACPERPSARRHRGWDACQRRDVDGRDIERGGRLTLDNVDARRGPTASQAAGLTLAAAQAIIAGSPGRGPRDRPSR